ncbi:MAG: HEPN domain-containing protein [Gemmataceae bacterium]|nr:HEPN domain-containing protein [Gemmataceae bacterium]
MASPSDKDARRFYRAAGQRLEDAGYLADGGRTTAAVYLAGYCVECLWKALIIVQAGKERKKDVLDLFRGAGAHNFDWLRSLYDKYGGSPPPKKDKALSAAFLVVASWRTDLRYDPGTMPQDDADEFLSAARRVWKWADERL